jgi:hypothetical protein
MLLKLYKDKNPIPNVVAIAIAIGNEIVAKPY